MARAQVRPGAHAPEFTLPSAGGTAISLADYRGRARVVLVFLRNRG
jgi:peroxiredoxin